MIIEGHAMAPSTYLKKAHHPARDAGVACSLAKIMAGGSRVHLVVSIGWRAAGIVPRPVTAVAFQKFWAATFSATLSPGIDSVLDALQSVLQGGQGHIGKGCTGMCHLSGCGCALKTTSRCLPAGYGAELFRVYAKCEMQNAKTLRSLAKPLNGLQITL